MKSKIYNKHLLVESDTSTRQICGTKRGLFEAIDQLMSLGSTTSSNPHENEISTTVFKLETQVVGWPPVRSQRKKEVVETKKYLKVAVDGVPYLRKVDLEMFTSYDQLLSARTDLFTICNFLKERKLMDPTINGVEYLPTYEDNDGDWMLLGDVPWKMFVESCKRLRLMKSLKATGFGTYIS
ncbi:Auxin-responsive protein IAA1 [Capsicum baccatum]|uniref:Auxin-responsive protein n=1 Tax=Capsicum baccatum TaxID=33114 RepID=A0A2G2VAN8_CAPBA|nr:Auxin-responsive protein IAA1 [Capsicum baccatum]